MFLSDRTEDEETNGNTMLLKVNPPAQRFIEAKLEEKIKSQVDELILNESYRLQEVMDQRMASFAQ